MLSPLFGQGFRVKHAVGLRTVLRHSHLQRTFYLGRFRKRQLTAQVAQQRAVRYQDAPSAHQFQFKRTLHQQGGLWGDPAYWVLLLAVFFRIVQRAAQHGMQVLVVRLDYVECGGDAAIALRNDQHGGTRCLFRLNLCGFGLLPVQVKRAFFNIAYHEVIVFHGTDTVHKIFVHRL